MTRHYDNIRQWCNSNQGLLTLVTVIIAVYSIIPFGKINFGAANTVFGRIVSILQFQIQIPIYLLILISIVVIIYVFRLKRKLPVPSFSTKMLAGMWRCEWANEESGSENLILTEDGHYIINGIHCFDIMDFSCDLKKRRIKFTKVGVRPGDNRKLVNNLTIENDFSLKGTEESYQIKYSKVSDQY